MPASKTLKLSVASLVLLTACGGKGSTATTVALKPKITISSTTDPISVMQAEIYGQALEKAQFRVARKKAFDTPEALYAAMVAGDVQLAGMTSKALLTSQMTQSGSTDALPSATASQLAAISKALPATLKIGAASTAEDKDVIVCAKTFTDTNKLTTLTELGPLAGTATLAAPDGFDTATPLGAVGLKDTYQIVFKAVVATASDKVLAAITAGTANCGVDRSADPALAAGAFTVLEDDKALVPNDVVLPLVAASIGTPDVVTVLDATSTKLTGDKLRTLMGRLNVDHIAPELVANEFTGNAGT